MKLNTTTAVLDEPQAAPAASQQAEKTPVDPADDQAPFDTPGEAADATEAVSALPAQKLPLATPEKLAAIPLDDLRRIVGEAISMLQGNDTLRKQNKPLIPADMYDDLCRRSLGETLPEELPPEHAEKWLRDLLYELEQEEERRDLAACDPKYDKPKASVSLDAPDPDDATVLADPDQPEEPTSTLAESDLPEPAPADRETDIQILARLQREWEEENVELKDRIAMLGVGILGLVEQKKELDDERKELTEKLSTRLKNGPPQHIAMHQREISFEQKESGKQEAKQVEPAQQAQPTEPPELDWNLDEADVYLAESRHAFTAITDSLDNPRALLWAIDGNDEDGYRIDDSHETLLIDTGLVGVKFATMADAQKAAEIADHRLAPQAAEAPADSASVDPASPVADPAEEDTRWKQVRLEKWPKPHCLAPGTLKIFAEADLHTIGDVSAYVESGKRLIDLKGFGEGKLEKYDDAQNAFWERWDKDPEKVIREEV